MADMEFENMEEQQAMQEPEQANGRPEPSVAPEETAPSDANTEELVSSKERLMRALVSDDEDASEQTVQNFRQLMSDLPRRILGQWKLIIICLAGVFVYITNGYKAQMEMMEESALETELKDWRYRSVTRISELTLLCRQSLLEKTLREQGDSTLQPSKVAPYFINASE